MKAFLAFLGIIVVAAAAFGVLILLARRRNAARGLPPPPLFNPFSAFRSSSRTGPGGISALFPAPRSGGVVGWFSDRIRDFRYRRSRGAYEDASGEGAGLGGGGYASGGRRARGLDPDEAWDARVGNEADGFGGPGGYYEEQELGLRGPAGGHDTGYVGTTTYGGRKSQDELDKRYDEEMRGKRSRGAENPFGDNAERSDMSLRGVSPRPVEDKSANNRPTGSREASLDESPTSSRRSMFRENV